MVRKRKEPSASPILKGESVVKTAKETHLDDGGVTRLDELGQVLNGLARSSVDLLEDGVELGGNVGGVAVENRRVAVADLSRVVEDNDLGVERSGLGSGLVLGVGADCRLADVHAWQTQTRGYEVVE